MKKHENVSKIHWLNSLPEKYKNQILDSIVENDVALDFERQYKIIVDIIESPKKDSATKLP